MTMYATNRKHAGVHDTLQSLLAWSLLLGLLSIITACGFHPRGSSALPSEMAVTFIKSAQPYGSLVDDFSDALQAQGGQLTTLRSEATAILHIVSNQIKRRILSVDTGGKVLEYELRQTISFSVETSEMLPLVEEQKVSLARDYIFSSAEALSAEREDIIIRKTLQRNLVNLAMLRITAAAR